MKAFTWALAIITLATSAIPAATSVDEVLAKYDKNHDGVLDASELAAMLRDTAEKKFDAMDLNKDGVVTKAEMDAAAQQDAKEQIIESGNGETIDRPNLKVFLASTDPEFAAAQNKDWFSKNLPNLTVQQSFSSEQGKALPAKLSYTYDRVKSTSFYNFDGAIGYTIDASDQLLISPAFEAHTTDQKSATATDTLTGKILFEYFDPAFYVTFASAYDSDSRANLGIAGTELDISPSWNWVPGLGKAYPLGKSAGISWRPYLVTQYGHVLDDGGLAFLAADRDFVRLGGRIESSLYLGQDASFVLTASYTNLNELTGLRSSYDYFELNTVYYLDSLKRFSIGASYKNGDQSPKFQKQDIFNVWLGIKLGPVAAK